MYKGGYYTFPQVITLTGPPFFHIEMKSSLIHENGLLKV